MKINNIEGYSPEQLRAMVSQGGKFVFYKYCISIVLMTFNNNTDIYFVPPNNSRIKNGVGPLFTNLFLGWWGIPWGPIYTIGNIATILSGGKDVTAEIIGHINQNDPNYGSGNSYNIQGQNNNQNSYNVQSNSDNNNTYNIPN